MQEAKKAEINIRFMLPSCVPATPFETSGACLSAEDLSQLIDEPEVLGLAELMNVPGDLNGDDDNLKKVWIRITLRKPAKIAIRRVTVEQVPLEEKKLDPTVNYIRNGGAESGWNGIVYNALRNYQLSSTGHHQGVIAQAAAYSYATVEEMLEAAREKGEDPFLILLDDIEDPHNLGAIIRTANLAGAHGVIIPKRRAAGLTAVVARASAGAINYTPVAKVTNLTTVIRELKQQGFWFVCADMGGELMYDLNLTGPIGLVIGNEGEGVSRLVREACDFTASIPMKGNIDSLNASVAAGVLAYEIVRQRMGRPAKG